MFFFSLARQKKIKLNKAGSKIEMVILLGLSILDGLNIGLKIVLGEH